MLGDYFEEWIETYSGRTTRGLSERSRQLYHRAISERVIPEWGTWRLGEVEPVDVRRLYGKLREAEVSTSVLRLIRAATSAMFATAVEDGILRTSPSPASVYPHRRSRARTTSRPRH